MKLISKMTPDEISELVSFTTKTGLKLYYSNLTYVSADSFKYNGEVVDSVDVDLIQTLYKGKDTYEAYKLQNTKSDMDIQLATLTKETIKEYFKADADVILAQLQENQQSIQLDQVSMQQDLQNMVRTTQNVVRSFSELDDLLSDLDLSDIATTTKQQSTLLAAARVEFVRTTDRLKQLFK